MNIVELEEKRIELLKNLQSWNSRSVKLFAIYDYFQILTNTNNPNIIEAFGAEFIEKYLSLLQNTLPFFLHPKYFEQIVNQINNFTNVGVFNDFQHKIFNATEVFSEKLELLNNSLLGNLIESSERKFKFPVLEITSLKNIITSGFIETISISVKKLSDKNNFIIIPSGVNLDDRLETQINTSLEIAINYAKKYIKRISKHHEVIIQFDKKAGNYTGNSLGTVLTLSFIEQLLILYNADYLINIKEGVTITGGIDNTEFIIPISDEIIRKKIDIVFYSTENLIVVPKKDENSANERLEELKKEFPKKNLAIVGIENLEDLFNRRNLIEIKKQNVVNKTYKNLKRNWPAALIIILLSLVVGFYFYRDWDDNPNSITADESSVYILNNSGKILWKLYSGIPKELINTSFYKENVRIVDINNDGINEVIVSGLKIKPNSTLLDQWKIRCFDKNKNIIWTYKFAEKIYSITDTISPEYGNGNIIDTLTISKRKSILFFSSSLSSFSSAIYRLDLLTGKRLPGIFWASGHFMEAKIKDVDKDGKPEILGTGYDNGFEDLVFFVKEIDTLNSVRLTTDKYLIRNYPVAKLKALIRFPKKDIDIYWKQRTPIYATGSFYEEKNRFCFSTAIKYSYDFLGVGYEISHDFNDIKIVINSPFRVARDSLVVHGELNPPLTDTEEYCDLIKSKIQYWNGKEFVYRKDLELKN